MDAISCSSEVASWSLDMVSTELFQFLQTWTLGSIVGKQPGARLTRNEMDLRIQRRAFEDEVFRQEFLTNSRFIYAMAVEESLGINKFAFVHGITKVQVLHEMPGRLYLILPSCHRGCMQEPTQPPEDHSMKSCHVCGMIFPGDESGYSDCEQQAAPKETSFSRKEIEDLIKKRAAIDKEFKKRLLSRPSETYPAYARELCKDIQPDFLNGNVEISVLEEGQSEIYFLLRAQ